MEWRIFLSTENKDIVQVCFCKQLVEKSVLGDFHDTPINTTYHCVERFSKLLHFYAAGMNQHFAWSHVWGGCGSEVEQVVHLSEEPLFSRCVRMWLNEFECIRFSS